MLKKFLRIKIMNEIKHQKEYFWSLVGKQFKKPKDVYDYLKEKKVHYLQHPREDKKKTLDNL